VGLAFSVLTLVQKHISAIQDNLNRNTELDKLEQSLWLDFNRYPKIQYLSDDNKLVFSTELDSIDYMFKDNVIIKDRDTFNIKFHSTSFFLDGNKVNGGDIDALKLETTLQNQQLFVFAKHDATLYMD
jgi:hypothetical protein